MRSRRANTCRGCGIFFTIKRTFKYNEGKGKAIPLQAWTGPEDSKRLMLPNFKTIGT